MATPRFTVEQVADALTKSHGFLSGAAKALGCTRRTITNYLNRHESLRRHVDELREQRLDFAEGVLMRLIKEGNVAAVIFFLKTQGRNRGYTERFEVAGESDALREFTASLADARARRHSERDRTVN